MSAAKAAVFYRRLGGLIMSKRVGDGHILISRGIQISRTWRAHFAWHLAGALGWRVGRRGL